MDNSNGDKNPYKELKINNADRVEMSQSEMEWCSILSNVINYVQHSKNPRNFHFVTIKPVKFKKYLKVRIKKIFC